MPTAPPGNGARPYAAPLAPAAPADLAPESGNLLVPVAREDLRRPAPPLAPPDPAADAEAPAADPADTDEVLIADARAGVSPAEMVELKLRSLLRTRGVSIELAGRARPARGRFARG